MIHLLTSVIGSYPRDPRLVGADFNPRWLLISSNKVGWENKENLNLKTLQDEAIRWAVKEQEEAGVDVVTDGEQRRGNYILYHCQHLDGFDFTNKEEKACRGGR